MHESARRVRIWPGYLWRGLFLSSLNRPLETYPLAFLLLLCVVANLGFADSLFDLSEIRDPSTLDIVTQQDWHAVSGTIETRQKLIEIRVGELWKGQDLRIPVRFIVSAAGKANGFHLTGETDWKSCKPM